MVCPTTNLNFHLLKIPQFKNKNVRSYGVTIYYKLPSYWNRCEEFDELNLMAATDGVVWLLSFGESNKIWRLTPALCIKLNVRRREKFNFKVRSHNNLWIETNFKYFRSVVSILLFWWSPCGLPQDTRTSQSTHLKTWNQLNLHWIC